MTRYGPVLAVLILASLWAPAVEAAQPASSARSRAAIARVTPKLNAALGKLGLRMGAPIFIRAFKESHEMELWVRGAKGWVLFRTYPIREFSGTLGPKLKRWDGQTPEGFYRVGAGALNPWSSYHLSFNLGYPNRYDRAHKRTGDFLMVHGSTVSIGCYAMTDAKIEEIFALADAALRGGQRRFHVHAFPFRLTEAKLAAHAKSPWIGFWRELKPCHDIFERTRKVPTVRVKNGHYACS